MCFLDFLICPSIELLRHAVFLKEMNTYCECATFTICVSAPTSPDSPAANNFNRHHKVSRHGKWWIQIGGVNYNTGHRWDYIRPRAALLLLLLLLLLRQEVQYYLQCLVFSSLSIFLISLLWWQLLNFLPIKVLARQRSFITTFYIAGPP